MDWTYNYMWCYVQQGDFKNGLIFNNNKQTKMKTKPGTSKPSGAGVGKGGPKTSPTDGGSLKPGGMKKGGMKYKKGGQTKKS